MSNRKRASKVKHEGTDTIAIVGMACRFPGARSVSAFWELLTEGRHAIREVPRDRFDIQSYFDAEPGAPGKIRTRMGGFIDDVQCFDANFFHISPRDARLMDPQQRIGLEVAYEAAEDAGVPLPELQSHSTGVYLGMHSCDYAEGLADAEMDVEAAVGVSRSAAAGRLCFALGLKGPSLVVDSDRSSSLVATHLACRSLLDRECDFALAGGTNLILSPRLSIAFSRSGLLSPDGQCKFCDEDAQGFVRSEGVGFVMLQRLSDAVAQGRRIYAVIRGGAVNADGGRSADFTSPSHEGQEALLREAYRNAGVRAADVGYVEAHGTGTVVGDPVEMSALGAVLRDGRSVPCLVGSVKTNIGHAEAAAGIAGLIKTALILKHRTIPATLHVTRPNPKIPFEALRLRLPTGREAWPEAAPLVAGVTSLGLTGINAHVVLEAAPAAANAPATEGARHEMVVLSAPGTEGVVQLATAYVEHLAEPAQDAGLRDIAFTAATRRTRHGERLAVVVDSLQGLRDTLQIAARDEDAPNIARGGARTKAPRI
ncbi:MAG TPA: beta-ketoacyl synthase N-terminal-like domain-containing protein, partial [Myxococcota bacterium]|nr:beta-ketoacyl synthase N-terminal-like domain-containing protein [Myxococcota bacterium]